MRWSCTQEDGKTSVFMRTHFLLFLLFSAVDADSFGLAPSDVGTTDLASPVVGITMKTGARRWGNRTGRAGRDGELLIIPAVGSATMQILTSQIQLDTVTLAQT
jgi:hypothetical protein